MIHSNTVAFVTGGNRGIGRELVYALLKEGVRKIYATSRSGEGLPQDSRVIPLKLDVTDADSIQAAVDKADDLTLLINNAGVLEFGDILTSEEDILNHHLATNLFGKLNMARAFVPRLKANGGGAIVNMLTLVALASMPGLAAYNLSKAACWSMTQSLRASLADDPISVHSVFPGAVDTDMLAAVDMDKASPQSVAQNIIAALKQGQEDIFPDEMSVAVYDAWKTDHKSVEKQFAAM